MRLVMQPKRKVFRRNYRTWGDDRSKAGSWCDFGICGKDATKARKGGASKWLKQLVDLIGIEPMTSSMPWNDQKPKLLTGKHLLVG